MPTTTTENLTPAEVREILTGSETEETTYLIGRTETVFAMLRLDEDGYPQDWLGIVHESEIPAFAERYRSRGERVEFVPINIELPDLGEREIPSRLSMNALATKSHATLSLFDDSDDEPSELEEADEHVAESLNMMPFFQRHEFPEINVTGVVDNIEGRTVLRHSCFGRENAEAEVKALLYQVEQVEYEETGETVALYSIGDTVFDNCDICDINAKHAENLLADAWEGGKPGANENQQKTRQFVEKLLDAAEVFVGDEWTISGAEALLNALACELEAIAELRAKLSLGTDREAVK